jgi:hypothetical protein
MHLVELEPTTSPSTLFLQRKEISLEPKLIDILEFYLSNGKRIAKKGIN